MAINIELVLSNLQAFYDFKNKTILSVGAGGDQFVYYARFAKKVYAVDNNKEALKQLEYFLEDESFSDIFTLLHSDFENVNINADVSFFDFCLHEMNNPELALNHALSLSDEVVISDHDIDSEWSFIADEYEKIKRSWVAVEKFKIKAEEHHVINQRFKNYNELFEKVKVQGKKSIMQIEKYKGQTDIVIPMPYCFTLI